MAEAHLSFEIICFNADAFLEPVLKSIMPFGDVWAVEGPTRFWQDRGFSTSTDSTNDILHTYLRDDHIVHGQFEEKDEEVNEIAGKIKSQFIFAVDADEIWDAKSLQKIIDILQTGEIDSMAFRPFSFFGGWTRYMTGFEENFPWQRVQRWTGKWSTHRPPTVLAPDGKPWNQHRHLDQHQTSKLGLRFLHFSYVMPQATFEKATYYAREEGTIKNWFHKVYLPWVFADKAGNVNERARIEWEYRGVHNWIPGRRGECFTKEFEGKFPGVIQDTMPRLKERFDRELAQWQRA